MCHLMQSSSLWILQQSAMTVPLLILLDLVSADEDIEDISTMEKLCSKVAEMETQRQSLVTQLRSQLEEDDVTSALMTNPGIDAEVRRSC